MKYKFVDNNSDKTLILFHGTGGDENVLLPIAKKVAPSMNHLSLRGEVVTFGQRRFSKVNTPEQLVDGEDLKERGPGILKIINQLQEKYDLKELWALGFSNGAMTLTSMLIREKTPFKKAVLLRPLDCQTEVGVPKLDGMPILIHSGKFDEITPSISAVRLEHRLIKSGAMVKHDIYPFDHRMKSSELEDIKTWFDKELKK